MASLIALVASFSSPTQFHKHQLFQFRCSFSSNRRLHGFEARTLYPKKLELSFATTSLKLKRRRKTLICAISRDAEESFKKTVEVDKLIDILRDANPRELQQLVVENILAFNESFWIRLAARTDTCKSDDDKKDYEELAVSVMSIVDLVVHKTKVITSSSIED